jgi:predicted HicB family RNase H-like nuclease
MAKTRQKTKTATMTLRVEPAIKAAAELAAQRDRRSLTSLVEVLILNHCKGLNITIEPGLKGPSQ